MPPVKMKEGEFIVKCQWPVTHYDPAGGKPEILVYNEDRTLEWLEPISKCWRKWFNGRLKVYAVATLEPYKDGERIVVGRKIPDQSW